MFVILVLNELWWRARKTHNEFSRKLVHIIIGSYVAFWPFYLSWNQIRFLSLAFILGVLTSKSLKIFQAIHTVQRPTWGELLFAISVGLITFITHNKWIYAAAILQMALADGLAAVIGIRYGKRNNYRILGHTKSIFGTLTFFIVSLAVLMAFSHFSKYHLNLVWMVLASMLASLLENLAAYGIDNLIVPLVVAFVLAHH
jgi:phytol kinase